MVKHQLKITASIREEFYPGYIYQTFFNIPHGTEVAELSRKVIMEKKWYQIYTRSNAEKKLYNKIRASGFEVFYP